MCIALSTCTFASVRCEDRFASPTEHNFTLCAVHRRAATILLDFLVAVRAAFGHFLDFLQSLVFLLNTILDASLILRASFAVVPWSVAGHASYPSALVARADISLLDGFRLRFGLLEKAFALLAFRGRPFGYFRFRFFWLVHLPCATSRVQAPAPVRLGVTNVLALKFVESACL